MGADDHLESLQICEHYTLNLECSDNQRFTCRESLVFITSQFMSSFTHLNEVDGLPATIRGLFIVLQITHS